MDIAEVVLVAGGLVVLVGGGELLVRGASGLAARLGLSPLVIGLTVVAFATSAPELAVTLGAALSGEPDLAVGNVVGSNMVNVLLVLGASAIVLPLTVRSQLVRLDLPILVGVSVLLLALAADGAVTAGDGALLLAIIVGYTALALVTGRRQAGSGPSGADAGQGAQRPLWTQLAAVAVGVGLLAVGARMLVEGAVGIATGFGVSSLVIGLTVVAVGTSLPELATSLIAARRGERDLAVGNIVGSCLFNICVVLGLAGVIAPGGVPVAPAAVALDIPLMIATSVALLPVAFTGLAIARWEGALFLALYAAYTAYLLLAATEHDALEGFTTVMLWFTLPLVALTLVVLASFEAGRRRGGGRPIVPR
ncbi:calcium/sodium antiporter [Streptomyces barkulensis]|uniref:calcium/sodium antiporter n=1 Tax=Streptomyces barkulensis TaxID=1257026 RepID=UPI000C6E99BC|nr:calcium/sodium antiporter [Streptomyces barkulensis]